MSSEASGAGNNLVTRFIKLLRRHWIFLLLVLYGLFAAYMQFRFVPEWEADFSVQKSTAAAVSPHFEVRVAHPVTILARPTPKRQAIAIWLAEAQAPAATPSPATGASLTTPIPLAYVVEIDSSAGYWPWLVDADGVAVSGRAIITPAPVPATPLIYYVAANAEPCVRPTMLVSITVSEQGAPPAAPAVLFGMSQEPYFGFALRRIINGLTDLSAVGAVLLAALFGSIIAWPFQQEAARQEEKRNQRAEEGKQVAEKLDQLRAKREQYGSLLKEYRKLAQDPAFVNEGARGSLEAEWKSIAPEWLQQLARFEPGGNIPNDLTVEQAANIGINAFKYDDAELRSEAEQWWGALLKQCISSDNQAGDISALIQVLGVLLSDPETGSLILTSQQVQQIINSVQGTKYREPMEQAQRVLGATHTIAWPTHLSASPHNADGCHPFGQEFAEDEPKLFIFFVNDDTRVPKATCPTVVFGADGTGKTTLALWLAAGGSHGAPRPERAFVIYPAIADGLEFPVTALDWAKHLAAACADYHVRFLIKNPRFLGPALDVQAYRGAVLRLLLWHYGSAEAAAAAFPEDFVLRSAVLNAGNAALPGSVSVDYIISLMQHAYPDGFERIYVVLDQDLFLTSENRKQIGRNLETLVNLLPRLAHAQIYVKLFLPETAKHLVMWPDWLRSSTLAWKPDELQKLLGHRLEVTQLHGTFSGDMPKQLIEECANNPRNLIRAANLRIREDEAGGV